MNPLANVHYPTNTEAELDRLQQLCERLAGFDERVSLEWLDGAMTALAGGPRPRPLPEWRDRLIGEAWSRAVSDPEDERASTALLESRWRVLQRQLDPELLMDAPDELRLAPIMLEWSDEDRAQLVADGEVEADAEDDGIPGVGEIWAYGFVDGTSVFEEDWPEPDVETDEGQAVDQCFMQIALLTLKGAEYDETYESLYHAEKLTRDDLAPWA